MAVQLPLRILRVEDLPGVREASQFRRRCIDATAYVERDDWRVVKRREHLCSSALATVACAAAAWRSPEWRQTRRRIDAGEQARADAMHALYELYRDGKVPAQDFDRVAAANADLRTALALLVVHFRERRHKWDG